MLLRLVNGAFEEAHFLWEMTPRLSLYSALMLGSTVDTCSALVVRSFWNGRRIQRYAWFNSGYKFMRHTTEDTSRCALLPTCQAHDALHHGRYVPEGQMPEVVVIIRVVAQRQVPLVLSVHADHRASSFAVH